MNLPRLTVKVMRKSLQGAIADMEALTKAANDKAEAWKTAMNQVFAPDEEGNIDDGTDANKCFCNTGADTIVC